MLLALAMPTTADVDLPLRVRRWCLAAPPSPECRFFKELLSFFLEDRREGDDDDLCRRSFLLRLPLFERRPRAPTTSDPVAPAVAIMTGPATVAEGAVEVPATLPGSAADISVVG
jgi:hypothetical protein